MSKYRIYTNQELLTLIDDKRHQSPIINELCLRLEKNNFNEDTFFPQSTPSNPVENVICPICEAKITLETNKDETKDN